MFQFDIGKVKKQEIGEEEEEQMNIDSMPAIKKEEAVEPEVGIELPGNNRKLKSR